MRIKKSLPYLIISILVLIYWDVMTWVDDYGWNSTSQEKIALKIALRNIFICKITFWVLVANISLFGFLNLIRRKLKTGLIIVVLALIIVVFLAEIVNKITAKSYYVVFINQSVAEEYIERPITEAGYYIGEILVKNISDKQMKNRRYAISGLAEIGYRKAIPVLEKISNDTTEKDYIRKDAIETIDRLKQ